MEKNKNSLLRVAISSFLLAGITSATFAAKTPEEREAAKVKETAAGKVKCAGRVVGGLNDCPTSQHACAGMGFDDNDPEEFIWLLRGTCNRISGMHISGEVKKEETVKKVSSNKKKS